MNGGKGEPSKTGGAKHPFLLCGSASQARLPHGGIYLSHQKGVECIAPLLIVPPNCASLRRGTGDLFVTSKGGGVHSTPSYCAAQLRSASSRHGGFICHIKRGECIAPLLIVPPNCASLRRGTGDLFAGQIGRRGNSLYSQNKSAQRKKYQLFRTRRRVHRKRA